MADFARSLDVGASMGASAPISRTLGRLVAFDAARRSGNTLVIRRALPDIPQRLLVVQSASACLAHERLARTSVVRCAALPPEPTAEAAAASAPFDGPGVAL